MKSFSQRNSAAGVFVRNHFVFISFLLILTCFYGVCLGQLTGEDVLILVNGNSPTSRYIAKMYREYHHDVPQSQVLELYDRDGFILNDCSGPDSVPADEILTRQQYEALIAEPVKEYLTEPGYENRVTDIKVIITTAGLPYRIEDNNGSYSDVIQPAGSNWLTVKNNVMAISAASVESELTCLWYSKINNTEPNCFDIKNRMVNPQQGCRATCMEEFDRLGPGNKSLNFFELYSIKPKSPIAEGTFVYPGIRDRHFNSGDMYFTARLDGPKLPYRTELINGTEYELPGTSAIYSVRKMLERAKLASDPSYGVNPLRNFAVLDDSPDCGEGDINKNRTFNLPINCNSWVYCDGENNPPDAESMRNVDDFENCFTSITGLINLDGVLNLGQSIEGVLMVLDTRFNNIVTIQEELNGILEQIDGSDTSQAGVIFYSTFGVNSATGIYGDPVTAADYLFTGGPGATGPLNFTNGCVFTSLESFNAVTMFSDVPTLYADQGKIVDFISVGGTAAIGHSMEPMTDGAIDNEFLLYNLLADEDGDGLADITFVEAAFTAIPYISWGEVVIGDPLMRIAYNCEQTQENAPWYPMPGDFNRDGVINSKDTRMIKKADGGDLNSEDPQIFDKYNDMCDMNEDGVISTKDIREYKKLL